MAKKTYKIPKFKSDIEAATFWDSHDSIKYLSETKPSHLKSPKPSHKIVIDLEERQWKILQQLAHQKKMSFNHLAEKLVEERLEVSH